jgi:hypothetical protein
MPAMRACAKAGCQEEAAATVSLMYGPREVVVGDLTGEHDPNLLDLCRPHADGLSPPMGWQITDLRSHRAIAR